VTTWIITGNKKKEILKRKGQKKEELLVETMLPLNEL
jgi:hypothetical protein